MKQLRSRPDAGFTLLEMLVVLAIISLLAAIIAPQVLKYLGGARSQTAQAQVQNVSAAVELFALDVGRYPSSEEGVNALVAAPGAVPGWKGPYLKKAQALKDPWGRDYLYRAPGQHGEFDVYSLGQDGAEGGSGESSDVGNW